VIILNNQQRKEEIKNKLLKIENFYDDCSLNLDDLDNIFLKITDKKFTNEDPRIMFLSPSKRFPKVFCSNLNYAH
jgi:hypothetical protein